MMITKKRILQLKLSSAGDTQRERDLRALRSLAVALDRSEMKYDRTGESWSDILTRYLNGIYKKAPTRRAHWIAVHFWARQSFNLAERHATSAQAVAKVWTDAGNRHVTVGTVRTGAARAAAKAAALDRIERLIAGLETADRKSACAAIVGAMSGIAEEYATRQ